jgi:hypothetical protein
VQSYLKHLIPISVFYQKRVFEIYKLKNPRNLLFKCSTEKINTVIQMIKKYPETKRSFHLVTVDRADRNTDLLRLSATRSTLY